MTKICDECLTAAYDEGATDAETQEEVCLSMGADIADHYCESTDAGTACSCACTS